MPRLSQKHSGAFFTPDPIVGALLGWAIQSPDDRLLDPSCGDGRFLAGHRNSVGIEQDPVSAATAMERAPWALIHDGDFSRGQLQRLSDSSALQGTRPSFATKHSKVR
jgi:adenine-specific DNA-methyltransferase